MKRILWRSSILIGMSCMLVSLPACGAGHTENNGGQVLVEEVTPAAVPDSGDEYGEASSDQLSDLYREVYKQIVAEKEGDGIVFSLIYLDHDDIPELAVCDRGYGTYSIYTVKDGAAFCMMDAMNTVEMDYFERKGVISQFARWNGGGEEGGYGWYYYQVSGEKTFVDGDLSTIHYTYDAVYDEEGNWTGEGVTKYYHMDQEIDEAAYQQMMNDWGVVEGTGKPVADNALGKTDMLNQLEQGKQSGELVRGAPEGQIVEQSFTTELDGFGKVIFAPFEPVNYSSENPDYGTTMFGDVRFMLLSPSDGGKIYDFPGEAEDNILTGFVQFKQVLAVAFKDYNEDGKADILLILEYLNGEGEPFRKARAYTQKGGGKEFQLDGNLSGFLWDYTESMNKIYEGITIYQKTYGAYYPENLSEEELTKLLNERGECYRKSAYYTEITDYWENVREVRDVSNHIEPLYESNIRYLTREELALDPPVVIHLAKNEIYARHGYIFEDQDLYNYFMGCIWYTPTTAPKDFSDQVFNEYEKENLKLFGQLDHMGDEDAMKVYHSVLENLYKNHTLPDGTDLGYDGITDLSWNHYAIYDIDQDGKKELIIQWTTTYTAGMAGIVYGFDSASGSVKTELFEYPAQTFYDNGVVEVLVSHNHGMAGEIEDFWPYTFYRYDQGTDRYLRAAEVDAWNKAYYETDYSDNPFPDDIDADGDGILYRVTTGNTDKLMDLDEYQKWRDSLVGKAKKVEIPFAEMRGGRFSS